MEDCFITPTSKQRAVALVKALAPLALVYVLIVASRFYTGHVATLPICSQLPWMRVVAVTGSLLLLTLAYLSYRGGIRIWISGQAPAPGTSVLFKRRVFRGWRAKAEAITLVTFAVVAAAALVAFLKFLVFSEAGLFVVGLRSCGP